MVRAVHIPEEAVVTQKTKCFSEISRKGDQTIHEKTHTESRFFREFLRRKKSSKSSTSMTLDCVDMYICIPPAFRSDIVQNLSTRTPFVHIGAIIRDKFLRLNYSHRSLCHSQLLYHCPSANSSGLLNRHTRTPSTMHPEKKKRLIIFVMASKQHYFCGQSVCKGNYLISAQGLSKENWCFLTMDHHTTFKRLQTWSRAAALPGAVTWNLNCVLCFWECGEPHSPRWREINTFRNTDAYFESLK